VLANLEEFRVTFTGGQFRRSGCSGGFTTPYIPFELVSNNDGRLVGVNKYLRLVLKIFFDQNIFKCEHNIYSELSKSGLDFVPQLYYIYQNTWMKCSALLISYVGEPIQDGSISPQDWQQLHSAVEKLHEVGIHHHDLKIDNIVRNSNGHIRLIDFSHAVCSDASGKTPPADLQS